MLEYEITQILDIAEEFWPKATPSDLGFLRKKVKDLCLDEAKDILEDAKMESNYSSIPFKYIGGRLKNKRPRQRGEYVNCWALHNDTGKWEECAVLSGSGEGAKEMMGRYLSEHHKEPTDYMIYVGDENFDRFLSDRHGILCRRNPKTREYAEVVRMAMETGTPVGEAIRLSGLRKEPNLPQRAKQMIEAVKETIPDFDPDIDDGIPF